MAGKISRPVQSQLKFVPATAASINDSLSLKETVSTAQTRDPAAQTPAVVDLWKHPTSPRIGDGSPDMSGSLMQRLALAFLLSLLASSTRAAHTQARLILAAETARPGDTVMAGIHLRMDPKWHTY